MHHRFAHSWSACRLALAAAGTATLTIGVLAGPASASASPVHVKRAVGPIVSDAPAGTVCDFPYHEEDAYTTNVVRFFDEAGNLVRVENQVNLTVLHRNSATGKTLVEEIHEVAHVDLVTGVVRQTGQTWHLRDEAGRLVFAGAGLVEVDLATGDFVRATPHTVPDLAAVCPLLGGTAA